MVQTLFHRVFYNVVVGAPYKTINIPIEGRISWNSVYEFIEFYLRTRWILCNYLPCASGKFAIFVSECTSKFMRQVLHGVCVIFHFVPRFRQHICISSLSTVMFCTPACLRECMCVVSSALFPCPVDV